MSSLEFSTQSDGIHARNNPILSVILVLVFIRPFICALAFPFLNLVYSLVLLVFLGGYLILKRPVFFKNKALSYSFILFCLALYVSIIFSQDKINSFVYLYQYVCGLGLFFIAASLSEKERLLTIQTILLAGLAVSFFAIYQYFWGPKHILEYLSASNLSPQFVLDYLQRRRAFSPFVTPGALGGFLAMILLLALTSKNRFWFILIVFPVFFLTKSPSVFLSLLLALMIYFSVQGKIKKSRVFALWALFFLLLVIVFLRFMTQKTYLQPTFSAMMRLSYWREALILIKAHPFIGMGPGNFNLENSRFAHNSYLQIWAEMGIFGLFSLIGLIGVIFKSCLRDLKQSLYKRQIAGLLAASAVFLIHNFLDFTFFLPEVSLIWWLILGLIAGL